MFRKLGNLPENISDDDRQILEQFVVILYDRFSAVKKRLMRKDWTYLLTDKSHMK